MALATTTALRNRQPARRHWTREEFDRAEALGLFRPEERLELIEGEIIVRNTNVNTPHAAAQRKAEKLLTRLFGEGYNVRGQLPLALTASSKPLPDIAVVIGTEDDYLTEHPSTAVLVMEISDTTLRYDRDVKARLYARAGLRDYWLLNLVESRLEVYREAALRGRQWLYTSVTFYTEADTISPLALPEAIVAVADLLPRRPDTET